VAESATVDCQPTGEGWTCAVSVGIGSGATNHVVRVSQVELERLAGGTVDPVVLVQASFEFLLERESNQSILSSFDISEIERYFSDYPTQIQRRLSQ
jgi:hypothetical protein